MGLFDFMKKKEVKGLELVAPMAGTIEKLESVPDEVFSKKMMGDGFAINPTNGVVVAPVDAEVATIFPTGHAVGLKTADGLEILIHVGVDTVNLQGEGFTKKVAQGDKVKKGDVLVEINLEEVTPKVPSILTPVLFTNMADYKLEISEDLYGKEVQASDVLMTLNK